MCAGKEEILTCTLHEEQEKEYLFLKLRKERKHDRDIGNIEQ